MISQTLSSRLERALLGPIMGRGYWHAAKPVGRRFTPGALGGYYLDFSAKADYRGPQAGSMPLVNYGKLGLRYNPVTVCQVALGNYERWLAEGHAAEYERRFLVLADWLVQQQTTEGAWPYDFVPTALYGPLDCPWISGMAQGQGLSVLVRAHLLTGQGRYLAAATAAVAPFFKLTRDGGVVAAGRQEDVYFEEVPSRRPSLILNGMIYAVWGLYDYSLHTRDGQVMARANQAVETLARRLADFDLGFWSRYDLYPFTVANVASPYYHDLHCAQLEALHLTSGRACFRQAAVRWQWYRARPANMVRAVAQKGLLKAIRRISPGVQA